MRKFRGKKKVFRRKRHVVKGRRFRRKFHKGQSTVFKIHRGVTIVPDHTLVKMTYTGHISQNVTAGNSLWEYVRGNSIWDPELAIGGRVTAGFYEWGNFYKRFIVFGSKISVMVVNKTALNGLQVAVIPSPSVTQAAPSDTRDLPQIPYCRYKVIGSTTGSDKVVIKHYMKTAKIFGTTSKAIRANTGHFIPLMGETQTGYSGRLAKIGKAGQNPSIQWFWNLVFANMDTTTAYNLGVLWKITYYVDLYDRDNDLPLDRLVYGDEGELDENFDEGTQITDTFIGYDLGDPDKPRDMKNP